MSFQRQIQGGVQPPKMKSPVSTGSDVQDIASLATAGAGIYKMYKDQELAEGKKASEERVASAALSAMEAIEALKDADGSVDSIKLGIIENKYISNLHSSVEKLAYKDMLSGYLGGDLAKAMIGKDLEDEDILRKHLREIDPDMFEQARLAAGYAKTDLGRMSLDEMQKVETAYQRISLKKKQNEQDLEDAIQNPNTANFNKVLGGYSTESLNLIRTSLATEIAELDKMDKLSPEYKERIAEMKNMAVNIVSSDINAIEQKYEAIITSNPNIKKEDMTALTAMKDNAISIRKSQIEAWRSMTDDVFKKAATLLDSIVKQQRVELAEAAPFLLAFAEIHPDSAGYLFDEALLRIKGGREIIVSRVGEGLQKVLNLNVGAASAVAGKVSLQAFAQIAQNQTVDTFGIEEREQYAADQWATISSVLSNTNGVAIMEGDEALADKFGIAAIGILKLAEEEGTREDMERASKLLGSDTFKAYMNILPSREKATLGKYVASSVNADLEKKVSADEDISYDVATGKIVSVEKEVPTAVSEFGGVITTRQMSTKGKEANALNKKLENAAEIIAETNPAFGGDVRLAKEYIISTLPKTSIKGKQAEVGKVQSDAIKNGLSVKEMTDYLDKDKASADKILKLEERLEQLQNAGLNGQLPLEQLKQVRNMSDEEYAELEKGYSEINE